MGLENAGDPQLSPGESIPDVYIVSDAVENKLVPLQNHGVKTMSIGYLLRELHVSRSG